MTSQNRIGQTSLRLSSESTEGSASNAQGHTIRMQDLMDGQTNLTEILVPKSCTEAFRSFTISECDDSASMAPLYNVKVRTVSCICRMIPSSPLL